MLCLKIKCDKAAKATHTHRHRFLSELSQSNFDATLEIEGIYTMPDAPNNPQNG